MCESKKVVGPVDHCGAFGSSRSRKRSAAFWLAYGLAYSVVISVATPTWCQRPVQVQPVRLAIEPDRGGIPPEQLPPVEAAPGLTMLDLETMALQSNPSITRMAALVGAARGKWVQSGLPPNPSVGYEGQQ